ncbi:hypothetical protein GCM10007919_44900 [Rhizobium indigoferae]|nr:hypothetical protein GCM10007919_44900 [Rhizobium indigoferae]
MIGPLINEDALTKIELHNTDAVQKAAMVRCVGSRSASFGTFFEPTVITDVDKTMRVAQEKTFGPHAPLIRFDDPDDVVHDANDTI